MSIRIIWNSVISYKISIRYRDVCDSTLDETVIPSIYYVLFS